MPPTEDDLREDHLDALRQLERDVSPWERHELTLDQQRKLRKYIAGPGRVQE